MPEPTSAKSRYSRFLTYGLFAWIALLIGFYLAQNQQAPPAVTDAKARPEEAKTPPRGFNPTRDVHDSVQAAKLVDGLVMKSAPGVEKIIAFVDVSTKDGHLVVHFKEIYNQLSVLDKRPLEDLLVTLWNQTEYVADRDWNPNVEFVEHDGSTTRSHIGRPSPETAETAAKAAAGTLGSELTPPAPAK